MAATNSTTNLGLPQWVATDKPERTDFNTAMSDIDNTVAAHLAENVTQGNPHGIDTKANKQQETWKVPEYLNGWTNNSNCRYRKNEFGMLELKGSITGGTKLVGTPALRVPASYYPIHDKYIITSTYAGSTIRLQNLGIDTAGRIFIATTVAENYIALDGILVSLD